MLSIWVIQQKSQPQSIDRDDSREYRQSGSTRYSVRCLTSIFVVSSESDTDSTFHLNRGVSFNQLTGTIPNSIGRLTTASLYVPFTANRSLIVDLVLKLTILTPLELHYSYLNNNQLTGTIPQSICQNQNVTFDLSDNDWNCPLPNCCSLATCGGCSGSVALH